MGGVLVVEALNLPYGQIEETHSVPDFDGALGPDASHGCTQSAVQFEYGQFVEDSGAVGVGLGDLGVGDDEVGSRFLDLVPVEGAFRLTAEVTKE